MTRDPIKDGRNWYSYCGNNPVNYFDAEGLKDYVIIICDVGGDLLKYAGDSLYHLINYLKSLGFNIVIKSASSDEELINLLVKYDYAVIFAHGSPISYARLPDGKGGFKSKLMDSGHVAAQVRRRRIQAGKGPIEQIILWSCYACMDDEDNIWGRLSKSYWGSTGLLTFPRGGDNKRGLLDGGKWYKGSESFADSAHVKKDKKTIGGGARRTIQAQ